MKKGVAILLCSTFLIQSCATYNKIPVGNLKAPYDVIGAEVSVTTNDKSVQEIVIVSVDSVGINGRPFLTSEDGINFFSRDTLFFAFDNISGVRSMHKNQTPVTKANLRKVYNIAGVLTLIVLLVVSIEEFSGR